MSREKDGSLRILVVCLGNICRSPAGEAALREAADEAGIEIEVESAGTGPWHVGDRPHPQIRAAGERAGLMVDGKSRQVTAPFHLDPYDLIFAMDQANLDELRRISPNLSDRMYLYRSFDPTASMVEMPDPYGLPDSAYDRTIDTARAGAKGIVAAITQGRIP